MNNAILAAFMRRSRLQSILIFISVLLISNNAYPQMKILKKLFSNEPDTTRSSSFLPLPVIGYSQETGAEIGIVSLYSFYTDKQDTLTRSSKITEVATFTTKKQSNFQLKSDIWSAQNKYHHTSEFRYKNFPFSFYGLGNKTMAVNEDPITQKFFRLNAGIEKRFGRTKYSGLTAGYESFKFTDKEAGGIFSTDPSITDRDGGRVLFLSLSQIIDSRNTNTYTTMGTYLKLNYSFAPDLFGGDNFTGRLLKVDLRSFRSLSSKATIGINGIYQSLRGANTPFYLLPQLGNDEIMRGYYTGRYREETLFALQAEIRLRFHPRFGVVGFAGSGTVFARGDFDFSDLKPDIGGGFRYFFDVERGLSIRLDYGIGEKRPGEERQSGFYLTLGESF